ncbi:MAG: 16S rRNA (uracil(1498)-N(3))-methyltransferase [Chloroflexi bacterium]|nr:16S rRNA (uracil(1498)-N(3))-methyltransferase [Chloroflexota bacterium]
MQRFFVDPPLLQNTILELPEHIAHQLVHVLRARQGEQIILLDDTGWEYQAELLSVSQRQVTASITGKTFPGREPDMRISLYQALVREVKMDWVLQKGTELGIADFIPVMCEHSLTSLPSPGKCERWRRIISEAAEQSGRTRLPKLEQVQRFEPACTKSVGLRLMATPQQKLSLKQVLPAAAPQELCLYIGPEGGFSAAEEDYACAQGILLVGLGERILRTETAGLAAVAAIMFHYDK